MFHSSYLPVAAEIVNSFHSLPQHLVLEISIYLINFSKCNFPEIDFSPLAFLGPVSLFIPRIDLYVRTSCQTSAVILGQLMSSLEKYECITKSIEEGVVVIHSGKRAPVCM